MGYLFAIDQGNTRIKAGVFKGHRLLRRLVVDSKDVRKILSLTDQYPPEAVIISSVASTPKALLSGLRKKSRVILFGPDTPLPIRNNYKTPLTLGSDRLAAAVGAAAIFPRKNTLVIDAGTCIKYDFIDRTGTYLGGSIAPGISMRLNVLHEDTDRLPLVKPARVRSLTGNDTRSSILTGTVLAAALEAEGFVERYRKRYGKLQVVLTGGDADRLSGHLNLSIFAAPDLVLTGLHQILVHVLSTP